MKNKPEWLDAALEGAPVVLRGGSKAYVRHFEEEHETKYQLLGGVIDDDSGEFCAQLWGRDGSYIPDLTVSDLDIIGLWQEPAPVFEHWHLINSKYVALAMDKNGAWNAYSSKNAYANERRGEWLLDWGDFSRIGDLFTQDALPTVSNWRQSLILRPEGENK